MEVMLAKKKPMNELASPLKIYPQILENVHVTDKKVAQDNTDVQTTVQGPGRHRCILMRESGTEPVVRVMVEVLDCDTSQKYAFQVVKATNDRGYRL